MSELVSGLLSGGWPFLVGWVFPSAIAVGVGSALVANSDLDLGLVQALNRLSATETGLMVAVLALGIGVILSAVQTPLYRLLEGYYFPRRFRQWRTNRHKHKRNDLRRKLRAVRSGSQLTGTGVTAGLLIEHLHRYPVQERQVAPTRLGNAIRAFETYGTDRFFLDSQSLWSELMAVVPEPVRDAQDRARAGVDFFVATFFLSCVAGLGLVTLGIAEGHVGLIVGGVGWLLILPGAYVLAVISTDPWHESVQALVDVGRKPLATALGLDLPADLERERKMWRAVGWLIREPYNAKISELLAPFAQQGPVAQSERPVGESVPLGDQKQVPVAPTATAWSDDEAKDPRPVERDRPPPG